MTRILKTGTCPTVSGASNLTYEIGCNDKSEIHFRISGNTGGGMFGDEWVAWDLIQPVLEGDKPITSSTLRPLFRGKSANTPGFLLAVLKAEGLVKVLEGFRHTRADPKAFLAAMDKLVAVKTARKR